MRSEKEAKLMGPSMATPIVAARPGLHKAATATSGVRDLNSVSHLSSAQVARMWGVCPQRIRYMRAREEQRKQKQAAR